MAVRVRSHTLDTALRSIERSVDDAGNAARSWIGFHAVQALRNAPAREVAKGWHDTGRQQRSYVFALPPGQRTQVQIGNFARSKQGYPYPRLNERKYSVAGRVLLRRRNAVVRAANREIGMGFREYRGSLRRARLTR